MIRPLSARPLTARPLSARPRSPRRDANAPRALVLAAAALAAAQALAAAPAAAEVSIVQRGGGAVTVIQDGRVTHHRHVSGRDHIVDLPTAALRDLDRRHPKADVWEQWGAPDDPFADPPVTNAPAPWDFWTCFFWW